MTQMTKELTPHRPPGSRRCPHTPPRPAPPAPPRPRGRPRARGCAGPAGHVPPRPPRSPAPPAAGVPTAPARALRRLPSSSRSPSRPFANMALVPCQVLRVAILLSYCSILCNYKAIEMPSHQTYGGSWKFLTFIDLVIQAVFFGICVLTDLSSLLTRGNGSQEQERQLKKLISLRDWMLAVLAFPVGIFVVAVFWIIYAYDREMIYPKLLDNFIPGWLNHGMHTTVLPFILIEMRTSHHAYPSRSSGLAAICTFSVGYILWVCWVHHVTGMWVYPFLEHIGPGARILFFGSTTILMNFLYLLGEVLNSYIWDTQRSMEEEKEKPKLE
ncbi:LOW QUALITY PROTEIN: androgen-induced gene 1 protein [Kogia breviceps]|uniref:LOW QUALITY PROTEIN: androgen-induced gene 1 protein n=1 Tax=Kogia breviceps TaxID=27615 RepID=UPI0027956D32|nr:LOW QUALITY PROTEIN: androgen-induced gene 1 protein [Kogia breviceps]